MCYDIRPGYSLVSYVVVPNQRKQWQLLKHLLDENFFYAQYVHALSLSKGLNTCLGYFMQCLIQNHCFFLRQVDGGPDAIGVGK